MGAHSMNTLATFVGLPILASPLLYIIGHEMPLSRLNTKNLVTILFIVLWVLFTRIATVLATAQTLTFEYAMIRLEINSLSLIVSGFMLLLASLAIYIAPMDITGHTALDSYYVTILVLVGTTIGLVCSTDLFNLWVWFEGTAITSYLLVAFYKQREEAVEASLKYFVQTATGSMLIVFGIALVFLETQTLDLSVMTATNSPFVIIAVALFIMGFGVKAALFPNWAWLPDAYTEAPTGVSALLSAVVTITALIVLVKILAAISAMAWGTVLLLTAIFNITLGNLQAIQQTDLKRLLAYSSICHIGYIVFALGIGVVTASPLGVRAGVLHMVAHALMKPLGFYIVAIFSYALGRDNENPLRIDDLHGVFHHYPMLTGTLIIALLGLAGMPLTIGFVSKWQIFSAGVQSLSLWLIALTVIVALNTGLSFVYYLSVITHTYQDDESATWQQARHIPMTMQLPIYALAIAVILLGISPNIINWLINPATDSLFRALT